MRRKLLCGLKQSLRKNISKPCITRFRVIEFIASRLAYYYKFKSKKMELESVLLKLESYLNAYIHIPDIHLSNQIEEIYKMFKHYGFKKHAYRMLRLLKEKSSLIMDSMVQQSYEMKIDNSQLELLFDKLLKETNEKTLHNFILSFVPDLNRIEERISDKANRFFLSRYFGKSIVDQNGVRVASIDNSNRDSEGNLIRELYQESTLFGFHFRYLLSRMYEEEIITKESIFEFVTKSPLFSNGRQTLIEKGINAYFDGNWDMFLHYIIPQIENGLLNFVEFLGGNILDENKYDGYSYKTMGALTYDESLRECLSNDIIVYFRTLFTDIRGFNIRNKICHGLAEAGEMNSNISDRVFHSLLFLGMIRDEYIEQMLS